MLEKSSHIKLPDIQHLQSQHTTPHHTTPHHTTHHTTRESDLQVFVEVAPPHERLATDAAGQGAVVYVFGLGAAGVARVGHLQLEAGLGHLPRGQRVRLTAIEQ